MRSASGPITQPKWQHNPAFSNASQSGANNLAIPSVGLAEAGNGKVRRIEIAKDAQTYLLARFGLPQPHP